MLHKPSWAAVFETNMRSEDETSKAKHWAQSVAKTVNNLVHRRGICRDDGWDYSTKKENGEDRNGNGEIMTEITEITETIWLNFLEEVIRK